MDIYVTNNVGMERTCLMVNAEEKTYNVFTGCLSNRYFRPDVLSVERRTLVAVLNTVKSVGFRRDVSLA